MEDGDHIQEGAGLTYRANINAYRGKTKIDHQSQTHHFETAFQLLPGMD